MIRQPYAVHPPFHPCGPRHPGSALSIRRRDPAAADYLSISSPLTVRMPADIEVDMWFGPDVPINAPYADPLRIKSRPSVLGVGTACAWTRVECQ